MDVMALALIQNHFKTMPLKNLSLITNNFGTSPVKAIAYGGNGILIAGAGGGKILRSADYGQSWGSLVTNPFSTSQINDICFSTVTDGLCVAVSDTGVSAVSADYGATWSSVANSHGGSQISRVRCDVNGLFHMTGDGGKYSKSTDATATAFSSLINIGFGTVICDNLYCGPDFVMISGHSGKLVRSDDWGDTWTSITHAFGMPESLWSLEGDGGNVVVVGVYDSSNDNQGKISVSTDKGLTFGIAQDTPFSLADTPVRMIKIKYANGLWLAVGDSSMMAYSFDLINWTQINPNPFLGGIVFKAAWADHCWIITGASGRIGRSLAI